MSRPADFTWDEHKASCPWRLERMFSLGVHLYCPTCNQIIEAKTEASA